jgi:hypothetical protein
MIKEYINPRQAIGDLFLAAVKDPSLKLIEAETGEQLTDGQRQSNLGTILQYAARFITSLEIKENPLFSLRYIDNFHIVTRTILNRDLPSDENNNSAQTYFDSVFSQMNSASSVKDFYARIGSAIDSTEESLSKSAITVTDKEITPDLRDLIETGYAILWGSYRIAEGKRLPQAVALMRHSVKGALKGALVSRNYSGILGGSIAHALIVDNFNSEQAETILSNSGY